ncbi:hypothetical protein IH982_00790 [Patescibacteria group bacterium]|nr:hypothetical protein [Patescibacteria group bacterium]
MSRPLDHLTYLKTAQAQGKLAHAYLLSGNDTAGKEQVIQGFVAFLLGPQKAKTHADVAILSPEKDEIVIGQIRKLKEQLSLSAWASPYKIGIIRSADRMNQEAQSAFLKLLEEPKGSTLLFLEAQHSSLLLDTIRSRTQELRLYRFEEPHAQKTNLLFKLQKSSLQERFAFAQRESQDPKALYETLLDLQRETRLELLHQLRDGKAESLRILRVFQDVLSALRQTQVNRRFAAERILLEL